MSTTGNPKVPPPTREATAMLMRRGPPPRKNISRASRRPGRRCASAIFRKTKRSTARAPNALSNAAYNPAGVARQLRAILASGSRKQRLGSVTAPTLVIHGTVDPLVRPEGRQGHRGLDPRRQTYDDRRHGPRPADPDVAADHRRDRQLCACSCREGGIGSGFAVPAERRVAVAISWSCRLRRPIPPSTRTCPETARRFSDRK